MKVNVDKVRGGAVALLLSAPFFMGMFPFGFPGYSMLLLAMLILTASRNLKKRTVVFSEVYFLYTLLIVMGFIFLYAVLLSTAEIKSNVQQVKNTIIAVLLVFLLISNVRTSRDQARLDYYFKVFLSVCTALFSAFGLAKFVMMTQGVVFDSILRINGMTYPQGASLLIDYNSFALFADIGFLSVLELIKNRHNKYLTVLWYLIAFIQFIAVLLSNSRRGLLLLLFILFLYAAIPASKKMIALLSSNFVFVRFSKHRLYTVVGRLFAVIVIVVFIGSVFSSSFQTSDEHVERLVQRALTIVAFFTGESKRLTSQRTMRWESAFEQFETSTVSEKLFGIGNDYLLEFRVNTSFDHPHNALISALLYGGIFSFAVYLLFYAFVLFFAVKSMYQGKQLYYALIVLFTVFYSLTSYYSFFYNISFSVAPFLLLVALRYSAGEVR